MDGLIQQNWVYKTQKGTPVTDSVTVARIFERQHKNVIRSIREVMGSANLLADRQTFYESTYFDSQGKQQPMFVMNRDGFCALVMHWKGEKADQFKLAFVEMFSKMEQVIQQVITQTQATTPMIPQTFSEALRLAACQAEQIEQQQKQLEEQKPRVLFSQAVESSQESILIGELARLICQNGVETGEKRLFAWMREKGFLCQYGERYNLPTQKAMELGLFEIKKTTITKPNGNILVSTTPKVTGKGQVYFINKFLHNNQKSITK